MPPKIPVGSSKPPGTSASPASTSSPSTPVKDRLGGLTPIRVTDPARTFSSIRTDLIDAFATPKFFILSIDGGGARGMIPAVILKEIERRSGRHSSELFDRICGTSTGSILACGLAAPKAGGKNPKFPAREIVEIYRTLGAEVFSRGSFTETVTEPADDAFKALQDLADHKATWFVANAGQAIATAKEILDQMSDVWKRINAPLHDVNKLAYLLYGYLGDLKMNEALTELFVYAYNIGARTPEILGSRTSSIPGARNFVNYRMFQAATASSAAVPFFAPYTVYRTPDAPQKLTLPNPLGSSLVIYPPSGGSGDAYDLVDGGNGGLGNPALFAAIEETPASEGKHKVILSLGTGHFSQPISSESKGWGFVQWLGEGGELMKSMFDGEADVTDMALRQLFEKNVSYYRWQPSIPESLNFLDEGSREDLDALEDIAQAFIAENDEEIDALVELLKKPRFVFHAGTP